METEPEDPQGATLTCTPQSRPQRLGKVLINHARDVPLYYNDIGSLEFGLLAHADLAGSRLADGCLHH